MVLEVSGDARSERTTGSEGVIESFLVASMFGISEAEDWTLYLCTLRSAQCIRLIAHGSGRATTAGERA